MNNIIDARKRFDRIELGDPETDPECKTWVISRRGGISVSRMQELMPGLSLETVEAYENAFTLALLEECLERR